MDGVPIGVIIAINVLVGWLIGKSKQREGAGILYGLLLGPLGWIVMILFPSAGMKCPHCGGIAKKGCSVCCHCGRDLFPHPKREPKVACPICSKVILRSSLHRGENTCPFCGETFEVE